MKTLGYNRWNYRK